MKYSHPVEQPVDEAHRNYNQWVANETMEDFALRYTAKHARRWSLPRIANTALGIVSFLALEAIGGAITLGYGFTNALYAILTVASIIFISGIPVCYHAAKTGVDIDLLTRGAGFGYIGSTISSLIYASFTFIFFALEAAIMSSALQILFDIPLFLAHMISALVVIPLVTHGITRISSFQLITQPIWIILQIVPLTVFVIAHSHSIPEWTSFTAGQKPGDGFDLYLFGAAAAVIFPLIAQNAEQVDYLRFLPKEKENTPAWWCALLVSGPGWVIIGTLKLLAGSFLAVLALNSGIGAELADDPTHMYIEVFDFIFSHRDIAIIMATFFVVISQLKINVTNAYAGSIAWSNFFSRLTNNHPGRIIWVFFNVTIAMLLMELGLYRVFEEILISFSALVLSWFGAITADLVINLPLKLRPKEIEFKRGRLYDINPTGFCSMLMASFVGIACEFGMYGGTAKALAPFFAFFLPFITVPLIAHITKGRYYLVDNQQNDSYIIPTNEKCECTVCKNYFDQEDILGCPYYGGAICSLCCSLESLCQDKCRPNAHLRVQAFSMLDALLPGRLVKQLDSKVGHFIFIFSIISFLIAGLLGTSSYTMKAFSPESSEVIDTLIYQVFFLFLIVAGVLVWLYVLAENTKKNALHELQQNTLLLQNEVNTHHQTSQKLEAAKKSADAANIYKTRYLSSASHELRTPLNTIFGYAQILQNKKDLPEKTREIASVISRSSEHLTDVIEGLLEVSKMEAKHLEYIHKETINFHALIDQICKMFQIQADEKQLAFFCNGLEHLPVHVVGDAKRIRQILINILSNAIKFTPTGSVTLDISFRNNVAKFIITDTGIGIPEEDMERIFVPFERIQNEQTSGITGTGLGLALSKLITELMGGDIAISSEPGTGTKATLQLMLPKVAEPENIPENHLPELITSYSGRRKSLLVVDDEADHRQLISDSLTPLGFLIFEAANAEVAFDIAQSHFIDLFILDIRMPGTDGWTLASRLRAKDPLPPIIMISGDAIEMYEEEMRLGLCNDFISKPILLDNLLEKIGTLLNIEWNYLKTDIIKKNNITTLTNRTVPDIELIEQLIWFAQTGNLNDIKRALEQWDKEYLHLRLEIESYLTHFRFAELVVFLEQLDHE